MSIRLGQYEIEGPLFLAPMAGVTDSPFRRLCRRFGADYAVGEMVASQPQLRHTDKSRMRLAFVDEPRPHTVQLLGGDPAELSRAFEWACEAGADVIDFNMGCPAKKVCNVACGSALMKDEARAEVLIKALGRAAEECGRPVTLKCRLGWDRAHKNAATIAKMAEQAGFALIAVHARTREDGYTGEPDYAGVAEVVSQTALPVVVNGDIADANRAVAVMKFTGARACMIGRAALGRPWVFEDIRAELAGKALPVRSYAQKAQVVLAHARSHHAYYGESVTAARTFRKHLLWYLGDFPQFESVRVALCRSEKPEQQRALLTQYFQNQGWL